MYRPHARWQAIHLCLCVNVSCLKMSWAKNRGSNDIERPKDNKRKSFLCHLFCTTLQLLFMQVTVGLTSRYHLRFFQQFLNQTLGWWNGNWNFLTFEGLWQINAQLWIWPWRSQNYHFQSQFSILKIIQIPPFFYIEEYEIKALFVYSDFWSTLCTKIGPNFKP